MQRYGSDTFFSNVLYLIKRFFVFAFTIFFIILFFNGLFHLLFFIVFDLILLWYPSPNFDFFLLLLFSVELVAKTLQSFE